MTPKSTLLTVNGWELDVSSPGEPRIRDTDLARRLGYAQPRMVRKLVKRKIERGDLSEVHQLSDSGEYWLNEEQAAVICATSEAENAVAMRNEIRYAMRAVSPTAAATAISTFAVSFEQFMSHVEAHNQMIVDMATAAVERAGASVDRAHASVEQLEARIERYEEQLNMTPWQKLRRWVASL